MIDLCAASIHFAGIMLLFEDTITAPGFDPLLMLVLAMLTEVYAGGLGAGPGWIPHPLIWIRRLAGWLTDKLDRPNRSRADRIVRGGLAIPVILLPAILFGLAVATLSGLTPFGWIIEFALLVMLLRGRRVIDQGRRALRALTAEGLDAGRQQVSALTRRDPLQLDAHAVARALVEGTTRQWLTDFVAPVFWYVLLGFAGLCAQQSLSLACRHMGGTATQDNAFRVIAQRLEAALIAVPAWLAAALLVLAAVTVSPAAFTGAGKTMVRQGVARGLSVLGPLLAGLAGALDLALGGPRHYRQRVIDDPWIGNGRKTPRGTDVRAALTLLSRTGWGIGLIVGLIWLLR